jgi:hypothetical protein
MDKEILPLLGIGSILAAIIGIVGAVVGAYMQNRFQYRKQINEYEHDLKKKRYLAINILLLTKLNMKHRFEDLKRHRPHIQTENQLDKEIEMEYYNAFLFASDKVLWHFGIFVSDRSHESYHKMALAMREDLWGKTTTVTSEMHFFDDIDE